MSSYTLGETMNIIDSYLENASDVVGAYRSNNIIGDEMGDDFENPDGKICRIMGSNNDGAENDLRDGDVEDEGEVYDVHTKESAMIEIYEAMVDGALPNELGDLFIGILRS